jgi:hypothetical protein
MIADMIASTAFQYPLRVQRVVALIAFGILALNAAEYGLAWVRIIYGWLIPWLPLPTQAPIEILDPVRNSRVFPTLLSAHLGLGLSLLMAHAVALLAPRITLHSDALVLETALGKNAVPDAALRGIRSMEVQPDGRYVVWVDAAKWLPLQNLLCLLMFGRWTWRGFMITSDLAGFDHVVARVVARLKQRYGEDKFEEHFSENQPTPLVSMLSQPYATVKAIAAAESVPTTRREAGWQMGAVALAMAAPMLLAAVIHPQFPWGAILMPLIVLGEWPLASLYLVALSEGYVRKVAFEEAMRAYPLTQLPRVAVGLVLALLVVAGWPDLLFAPLFLPAVAIGAMTVAKLTEDWFKVKFTESLIGIVVPVIYQVVVYGLFYALLPR